MSSTEEKTMILCDCCGEHVDREDVVYEHSWTDRSADNPYGSQGEWCPGCAEEWSLIKRKLYDEHRYIYNDKVKGAYTDLIRRKNK
jgi:hypothetical protein